MLYLGTVIAKGGLSNQRKPVLHIVVVITDKLAVGNRIRYHSLLQTVALSPISYQRIVND